MKYDKGRGLFTCITLTAYESHYEMLPVVYIIVGKTGRSARTHTNTHQPQLPDSLAPTEGKWRDLSLWLVITSKIREHTLLCNCSVDRKNKQMQQRMEIKMPIHALTYPGLKRGSWCLLICPAVCIYESISPQVSGGAPSVPALYSSGVPLSPSLSHSGTQAAASCGKPSHSSPLFPFFPHSSVWLMQTHLLALFAVIAPPTHTHTKKRITQANHSREGFWSPSDSSVGQGALHLSPRGEGARCCCDGCLCLRH